MFKRINIPSGNVSNHDVSQRNAIRGQYAPGYLAELEYCLRRRHDLKVLALRLLAARTRASPMPHKQMKPAEPCV